MSKKIGITELREGVNGEEVPFHSDEETERQAQPAEEG